MADEKSGITTLQLIFVTIPMGIIGLAIAVGGIYLPGWLHARDKLQLAQRYMRPCKEGKAYACDRVGSAYEGDLWDHSSAHHFKRAVPYFRKACRGHYAYGCEHLADLYDQGFGVRRNYKTAFRYFKMACDNRHTFNTNGAAKACGHVGHYYEIGRGVKQSDAKALHFYKIACHDDDPAGCQNLGRFYEHGRGGLHVNIDKALKCYNKACEDHMQWSCRRRRKLWSKN